METNDPERLRVVMRVYMEQQEKKNHNWRRQVSSAKATIAELTRENRALSQQVTEPQYSGRGMKQTKDYDSWDHGNSYVLRRIAKIVFMRNKFVGKSKLLEYTPNDRSSLCYEVVSKTDFPGGEITQAYLVGKLAPLLSKGLQEERCLHHTAYKNGYMSECTHCTVFVVLRVSQLITVSQHQPN